MKCAAIMTWKRPSAFLMGLGRADTSYSILNNILGNNGPVLYWTAADDRQAHTRPKFSLFNIILSFTVYQQIPKIEGESSRKQTYSRLKFFSNPNSWREKESRVNLV